MTEAILKAALVAHLRKNLPGFVIIRHEDRLTSGVPDISVSGNGRTTWWEVKLAPGFKSKGIQKLTLLKLSLSGYARYIIYDKSGSVYIVQPKDLDCWDIDYSMKSIVDNHASVCGFIQGVHR
jgi:hypothetical protein